MCLVVFPPVMIYISLIFIMNCDTDEWTSPWRLNIILVNPCILKVVRYRIHKQNTCHEMHRIGNTFVAWGMVYFRKLFPYLVVKRHSWSSGLIKFLLKFRTRWTEDKFTRRFLIAIQSSCNNINKTTQTRQQLILYFWLLKSVRICFILKVKK